MRHTTSATIWPETTIKASTVEDAVTLEHPKVPDRLNLFFDDDADVSRLIHQLEIVRYRMRHRAHLPTPETFDARDASQGTPETSADLPEPERVEAAS